MAANRLDATVGRNDLQLLLLVLAVTGNLLGAVESMRRRLHARERELSALVEGLSVFAVSYYVFNLVKYALDPLLSGHEQLAHRLYAPLIAAIVALAWLFITHRKKKIEGAEV